MGIEAAFGAKDQVITAYRCHGFALMRGGTVRSILAELLGKKTGVAQGKGGSMHMFAERFFGGNGIVGAQVPIGAGLAFAQKYIAEQSTNKSSFSNDTTNEHGGLSLALYGDGAANQGQVYEAFNMAALWKLPCVFICENNKYSMGTSVERSSANRVFYTRGDPIPGLKVNAMDILAVKQSIKFAQRWTREGRGPLVMEYDTYRYHGHSMSDPGTTYRTRQEISDVRTNRDPIKLLAAQMLKAGVDQAQLDAIEERAKAQVEAEAEQALSDPLPTVEKDLWTDIY